MNSEAQEIFNQIVVKTPEELNPVEVDFLRARRSYLNEEQKVKFAVLLGESVNEQLSKHEKKTRATTQYQKPVEVATPPVPQAPAVSETPVAPIPPVVEPQIHQAQNDVPASLEARVQQDAVQPSVPVVPQPATVVEAEPVQPETDDVEDSSEEETTPSI